MNRLLGVIVLLALGSQMIVPIAEMLEQLFAAAAVFLLAFFGLVMIARAPFG